MRRLSELFRLYEQDYLCDKTSHTRYASACFFRQVLRALGDQPLAQITPEVLREWKAGLLAKHCPGTVHRYLSILDRVFRAGVADYQWLEENPFTKIRKPSPSRGRVRFLLEDERQRLFSACAESKNGLLYPIVVTALCTGGRKNEILRLQWSDVDFDAGVVRFVITKTRVSRSVPLIGEARTLLESLAKVRQPGAKWVFPGRDTRHPRVITTAWYTAVRRAGIENFRFHDLRHTTASYLAMSGASMRDIAEVLGHRNIQHTMRYSHLLQSHTAGVLEKMSQKFLGQAGEGSSLDA